MKPPSSISIFIFLTIILGCASILVNSQTDSCNTNTNINGLPFETSSFNCLTAWNTHNFVLRYAQTSTNVWSFVLSAPASNSYVAIGFSSSGNMVGSDAVVGWISSDGTGSLQRYYLGGQTPSQVVLDTKRLNINSSAVVSQNSRIYLAFQLITTTQPTSQLLYALGPIGSLPSAPDYSLTEHRDMVSTTLDYVSGGQTTETSSPYTRLRKTHGALSALSWGIMMIIGAIVARHCKQWDPAWFYAHTMIQLSAFILGVIGIICGLVLEDRLGADVSTHKGIGIFVLVLGCLQVMAFFIRPDKTSKVRKYWNWYHFGVGRILLVFAIANVFYGIHLGEKGNGPNVGYGIILAILFVVSVVLEVKKWVRN